ncbi:MAG: hypothetical protein AAF698_00070 [Pseudomonadota bacterium]
MAAGLGPESVAALGGGDVAASRLVALAPPDGTDPRLRRLFDRMIVPCSFARATADMLRAAEAAATGDGDGVASARFALGTLPRHPAWQGFRDALLALSPGVRQRAALRLGELLVLEGLAAPLFLIAPHIGLADAAPSRALIDAHLSLARGDRDEAIGAFASLSRRDETVGQIATVLLAEILDPTADMPLPAGWLAHIDLLASIATEHAGAPFGERAALAEVRLSAAILGPAAALRALSLSHRRGAVSVEALERNARRLWARETRAGNDLRIAGGADNVVAATVWAAADPESFAGVLPQGLRPAAGTPAPAPPRASMPDGFAQAASGAQSVAEDRDATLAALPGWRGLISDPAGGALTQAPSGASKAGAGGQQEAGNADPVYAAGDRVPAREGSLASPSFADGTSRPVALLERSSDVEQVVAGPVAARQAGALLADVERFLQTSRRDLDAIKEVLDDG